MSSNFTKPNSDVLESSQQPTSNVGGSALRSKVDRRHPQWKERSQLLADIQLMYQGGGAIRAQAGHFLQARPKEPQDVYQYRLGMFCYENNLGAGIGWHEAAMFEEQPSVNVRIRTAPGKAPNDNLSAQQQEFYLTKFLKDCDKRGTAFTDFFRKVFNSLLLYQKSYIVVDLPKRTTEPMTLQEEMQAGYLDPYISALEPLQAINWDTDDYGNLKWIIFYAKSQPQDFLSDETKTVENWFYYDTTMFRVYQATSTNSTTTLNSSGTVVTQNLDELTNALVTVTAEGKHALSAQGKVPVVEVCVPEGWWMGNRAYLPALAHINVTAGLDWSLFMTALAFPVIYTDIDLNNVTAAEWGFLKLNPGDKYEFAEPSGRVWAALEERGRTLKEEIWRALYLVSQARNTSATAMAASAASKQADMQPSKDVLNGLGDKLREAMKIVLSFVALARSGNGNPEDANLVFEVGGLSFEDKASFDDIAIVSDILQLGVRSRIFQERLAEVIVRAALKDASEETITAIIAEFKSDPETPLDAALNSAGADPAKETADLRRQMAGFIKDDPEGAAID